MSVSGATSLALLRPMENSPPAIPPAPPIPREANIQMPTNRIGGMIQDSTVAKAPPPAVALNSTLWSDKAAARSRGTETVVNWVFPSAIASFNVPRMESPLTTTDLTLPASR